MEAVLAEAGLEAVLAEAGLEAASAEVEPAAEEALAAGPAAVSEEAAQVALAAAGREILPLPAAAFEAVFMAAFGASLRFIPGEATGGLGAAARAVCPRRLYCWCLL